MIFFIKYSIIFNKETKLGDTNTMIDKLTVFFSKIFEQETGNALRYRCIYFFGLVIHAFFAIAFYALGIEELFIFNCISVAMYFLGSILISNTKMTIFWVVALYTEIIFHGVFANILLGWNYGFSMYPMAIIPLSFFVTYMDRGFKRPVIVSTVGGLLNIGIMLVARIYCYSNEPIYYLPIEIARLMSGFNMVMSDLVLLTFAFLFVCEIRTRARQLKEKNDELNFLAHYDRLTSLRNRHSMIDLFKQYEMDTKPYCVILGDIDDFKRINDTYGHAAGDKVLKHVSDTILKNTGENGVVCRWGGEEILIIMSGTNDFCFDTIEKIRLCIQNMSLSFERREIRVTMTFGFADYGEAMNVEKLISIADARLYKGKKNGKNQTVTN